MQQNRQGNTINFKNTVIIATSNAGFGYPNQTDDAKVTLMDRLKPYFRPEFLNRFNALIEFKSLAKEDLKEIVDLMLADVNKTIVKKGMTLEVTDEVKEKLMVLGYDPTMGVRPLRRIIEQEIRDKMTDFYLDHSEEKHLKASIINDDIIITAKN